jgi:cytochrome c-type biogenesis protein CcmH/NrfG
MKDAGRFFAMLLERWKSKTPKGARIKQYIISGAGTAAFIVLSIPSLGLPLWVSIAVGVVAATSVAYEQVKDESDETVVQETKKIFKVKTESK